MFTGREFSARRGRVHLRMVAYAPVYEPVPEGHLRVVVQVVEGGEPITEDPIHVEVLPESEFNQALEKSAREGWEIRPWKKRAATPPKAHKRERHQAA